MILNKWMPSKEIRRTIGRAPLGALHSNVTDIGTACDDPQFKTAKPNGPPYAPYAIHHSETLGHTATAHHTTRGRQSRDFYDYF